MLSPQVKQVVESSEPADDISFLISVRLMDEIREIASWPDASERRKMLFALYHQVKGPLLDTVSRHETDGMRVLNELEGSPQMIVSGPARTWQRLFDGEEPALNDPKVFFAVNSASFHLVD